MIGNLDWDVVVFSIGRSGPRHGGGLRRWPRSPSTLPLNPKADLGLAVTKIASCTLAFTPVQHNDVLSIAGKVMDE